MARNPQMLFCSYSLFPLEPCAAELNSSSSSGVLPPCLPSLCKCATLQGFTGREGDHRIFSMRISVVVPHFKKIFSVTTFSPLRTPVWISQDQMARPTAWLTDNQYSSAKIMAHRFIYRNRSFNESFLSFCYIKQGECHRTVWPFTVFSSPWA